MADQDFNIKVVTTADTSGIAKTTDEIRKLRQEALRSALTPVPEGLGGTATTAKAPEFPKKSEAQLLLSRAEELFGLSRRLQLLAAGAVIAGGYKFVSDLRAAATEIEKISVELGKQGGQIVSNAQKFAEMSRFARDNADIIKIGEGALNGVEQAQARLLEAAGKELSTWQKIQDVWTSGFDVFSRGVARPQADALKLQQAMAAQNYEMARMSAIQAIASAKIAEARHATQTYEQTIKELTDRMKEQQTLANTHWQQKDVESYLVAASAAEKYKKEIESVEAARDKAMGKAAKEANAADSQVKAIIGNEQAAAKARAEGRDKDADMYQKSADQYRKSATEEQRAQADALEKNLGIKGPPKTVDEWRKQQQQATEDFNKAQKIATEEFYDPDLKETNRLIKSVGGKPITKEEDTANKLRESVDDLGRKFDRYWGQ